MQEYCEVVWVEPYIKVTQFLFLTWELGRFPQAVRLIADRDELNLESIPIFQPLFGALCTNLKIIRFHVTLQQLTCLLSFSMNQSILMSSISGRLSMICYSPTWILRIINSQDSDIVTIMTWNSKHLEQKQCPVPRWILGNPSWCGTTQFHRGTPNA